MKDREGNVTASVPGVAHRARVTLAECQAALKKFESPDPMDTSKVEQGIKIKPIPGGWQVVNHEMYQFSTEARREMWRQNKEMQRHKAELLAASNKKRPRGGPRQSDRLRDDAAKVGDQATIDALDRMEAGSKGKEMEAGSVSGPLTVSAGPVLEGLAAKSGGKWEEGCNTGKWAAEGETVVMAVREPTGCRIEPPVSAEGPAPSPVQLEVEEGIPEGFEDA
jgi:hypothetical protein